MPQRHTGSGGTAPYVLNLSTRWVWVVTFTLHLLYLWERTPVPPG